MTIQRGMTLQETLERSKTGIDPDAEAKRLRWLDRFEEDWEVMGDDLYKLAKQTRDAVNNMWEQGDKDEKLIIKDKMDAAEREKRTSEALEKGWKPETTDSLQEIGNFLGTNPRSVEQRAIANIERTVHNILAKMADPKQNVQRNVFPPGL